MSSGITRRKGQSEKNRSVECAQCGAKVPRDKAIVKRRFGVPLDSRLRKTLLDLGARLHACRNVAYYCVSCAKHRKYV